MIEVEDRVQEELEDLEDLGEAGLVNLDDDESGEVVFKYGR